MLRAEARMRPIDSGHHKYLSISHQGDVEFHRYPKRIARADLIRVVELGGHVVCVIRVENRVPRIIVLHRPHDAVCVAVARDRKRPTPVPVDIRMIATSGSLDNSPLVNWKALRVSLMAVKYMYPLKKAGSAIVPCF